ncbi:MAG: DUF4332 domain-containing protein [Hyphomicrobiaceae bacterium]
MREPQMTVCRCCGQAMAMAVGTAVEVDRRQWTPRIVARAGPLRLTTAAADVFRAAEDVSRNGGAAGASPVEVIASIVASEEGAGILARLGCERERLGADLAALCRVRAAADPSLGDEAASGTSAAAEAMSAVIVAAGRLAEAEGSEAIEVRHLLAAYAAPECAWPGARLLRAALCGRDDAARMASTALGTEAVRAADVRVGAVRTPDRTPTTEATGDPAGALRTVELALAALRGEVARLAVRLGQVERLAVERRPPGDIAALRPQGVGLERRAADSDGEVTSHVDAGAAAAAGLHGGVAAAPSAAPSHRRRARAARPKRRRSARGLRLRFWQRITARREERAPGRMRRSRLGRRRGVATGAGRPSRAQMTAALADHPAIGPAGRQRPLEQALEGKRFHLAADDDIVDAPGIGPRTAERFREIGVRTVRDLLRGDASDCARRIATRWIRPETIAAWQAQARLVCTVPWLRGTHAQLLVGAGFASVDAIVEAEPGAVAAAVLRYAATREGRSILRDGAPPEADRIETWLLNACEAETGRASDGAAA